jgi:hypothetical protein
VPKFDIRDMEVTRMKANKSKKSDKYDMMSSASSKRGAGIGGSALARRQQIMMGPERQSNEGSQSALSFKHKKTTSALQHQAPSVRDANLSAISIPDPSKATTSGRALSPDYLPN